LFSFRSPNWRASIGQAALADLARQEANDADGGRDADLLADVWEVFYQTNKVRLHTDELCAELNIMAEAPWGAVNGGKGVDGYYLRKHLTDFLPNDAEKIAPRKWREGTVEARGYHEKHFEDAFNRYLGRQLPSKTPKSTVSGRDIDASARARGPKHPSHPSQRSQEDDNADKSNASSATDESTAPVSRASHPSQDDENGTDPAGDSGSPARVQTQQNEASPGGAAREEVTKSSSPGQVQTAPHGAQTDSDSPNKLPTTELPRGVSVRRRSPPKEEN
jgi:hypothetical protein